MTKQDLLNKYKAILKNDVTLICSKENIDKGYDWSVNWDNKTVYKHEITSSDEEILDTLTDLQDEAILKIMQSALFQVVNSFIIELERLDK